MKLESAIQADILRFLSSLDEGFFFKTVMCNIAGVPDICGVYKGHSIWIEVKSAVGKLSPIQVRCGAKIKKSKGHWLLARSVEDVKDLIKELDNE